jgi:hypothetical protein
MNMQTATLQAALEARLFPYISPLTTVLGGQRSCEFLFFMNVVELFYLVGFFASAFFLGWLLGKPFGAIGWWIGSVLGLICWGGLLWGITVLIDRNLALPTCRRGTCQRSKTFRDYGNYRLLKKTNGAREFQCKCGDKYFLKENRLMFLDEDGVPHPYMRRKHSFAQWEKDDS